VDGVYRRSEKQKLKEKEEGGRRKDTYYTGVSE